MPDPVNRYVEFDKLNLLGKAVFITGSTLCVIGRVLETVVEIVSGLAGEAEKAFREGLDSDIQDATILEEKSIDEV